MRRHKFAVTLRIITADDAAPLFRAAMERVAGKEAIFVLPLDAEGRKITNPTLVAFGAEKTAACEPKTIFRAVFGANAESFIVAHNHPSGNPTPSRADVEMTRKLIAGAELLGVRLLDHLILGDAASENGRGFVSIFERMESSEKVYVPEVDFAELQLPHIEHLRYNVKEKEIRKSQLDCAKS